MNENNTLNWYNACKYGLISELTSADEVREMESISYNLAFYTSKSEIFNEFLSKRFGYDIEGFRKLYLKEFLPSCNDDDILGLSKFINPIPPTIRFYCLEVNSLFELMFKYNQTLKTIKNHSSTGPLCLHDSTISNFTIIRARFSRLTGEIETLETMKNERYYGYFFSTEKFRFLISSSIQLDLTVIYEEL